jgi:hypothetical protein
MRASALPLATSPGKMQKTSYDARACRFVDRYPFCAWATDLWEGKLSRAHVRQRDFVLPLQLQIITAGYKRSRTRTRDAL